MDNSQLTIPDDEEYYINRRHITMVQYQAAITAFIFLCVFVYIYFRDN